MKKSNSTLFQLLNAATFRFRVGTIWEAESLGDGIEEIIGYSKSEFLNKPKDLFEFVHEDDRAFLKNEFSIAIKEKKDFDIQFRLFKNSGVHYWVLIKGTFSYNDLGLPVYVNGVIVDIHRQKKEELSNKAIIELSEFSHSHSTKECLQKFLDTAEKLSESKIGFYHFVDEKEENLSLQAWSTHTLMHMCKADGAGMHYPISKAGIWCDCVKARKPVVHNDYEAVENKRGLPKGHAQIVRELVVPVIRNSKIVAILGVGNKVSEYDKEDINQVQRFADLAWDTIDRKKANDSLIENQNYLKTIIDTTIDGFLVVNSDGNIIDANTSFSSLVGFSRDELIHLNIRDLEVWEAEDGFIKNSETIRQKGNFRYETQFKKSSGTIVEVEASVSFTQLAGEKFVYFISDISKRKNAKREIKKQLQEKETLLKEVHHRIKNNIASIEALLVLQFNSIENDEAKNILMDSIARIQSMRVLYNKLLINDNDKVSSISDYVHSLVNAILDVNHGAKNISIKENIESIFLPTKHVFTIGIIINELMTNSIKYAFKNNKIGEISILFRREIDGLLLIVKDNGSGFEDNAPKLASSGFGLRIIQMLSEQLGGNAVFDFNEGTTCTILCKGL
jgi:PAS domain S-box-containing protein